MKSHKKETLIFIYGNNLTKSITIDCCVTPMIIRYVNDILKSNGYHFITLFAVFTNLRIKYDLVSRKGITMHIIIAKKIISKLIPIIQYNSNTHQIHQM